METDGWQPMDCVICGEDHGWERKIVERGGNIVFRFRTTLCPATGLQAKAAAAHLLSMSAFTDPTDCIGGEG